MSARSKATTIQSVQATTEDWLSKPLLRLLSPFGKNTLCILIYHRVLAKPDPLFPDEIHKDSFSRHLGFLKSAFNVISLQDAVRLARADELPPRTACITFDDGYADNALEALPILQQHGMSATFFIATGFLDGGRMWNDTVIELVRRASTGWFDARTIGLGKLALGDISQRRAAIGTLIAQLKYRPMEERLKLVERLTCEADYNLAQDLMMSSDQVRQLRAAGMEIGAHTVNHPILAKIPANQAGDEIATGKLRLENILGEPVHLFAYPNGKPRVDYCAEHVGMVREIGFDGAVSTAWGGGISDLHQLPRFTPWDQQVLRFHLRLALNLVRRADLA